MHCFCFGKRCEVTDHEASKLKCKPYLLLAERCERHIEIELGVLGTGARHYIYVFIGN